MTLSKDDADEAREKLDASIREARGLLKDCRDTIREMRELIPHLVASEVADEAAKQLAEIGVATKRAIEESERKVFERFDNLADTLLGTTNTRRSRQEPSIEDMVRVIGAVERRTKKKGTFDA